MRANFHWLLIPHRAIAFLIFKEDMMSKASIILVDDEEDVLPEYQEMLEIAGMDALISADPEQAFAMVCGNAGIELVVTDLRMARLDGAGLICKLRDALPARNLRFIVITGDATVPHDPAEIGGRVLLKPVDRAELIAAVTAALSERV
ncbi:response regulator [Novosphingobium sp.]|uniref:response regulator n=1 Tax=Novosphingobium sp. TaxID=1874826 RepID=UPI0035B0EC4B